MRKIVIALLICSFMLPGLPTGIEGATDRAVAETSKIVQISAGESHSLALMSNGDLYAWGSNWCGQLGYGTNGPKSIPVLVGTGFTKIAAGSYHTLALKGSDLYVWGRNVNGQLGDGTTVDRYAPVFIGSGFTQIAAGHGIGSESGFSFALKGSSLYAWGDNEDGQLGDGTNINRLTPTLTGTGYTQITGGYRGAYAFKGNALYAWGTGYYASDGSLINSTTPVLIGSGYSKMADGYFYGLTLKNGELYANGRIGVGCHSDADMIEIYYNTPTLIGTGYTDVVGGFVHAFALKGDALYAWGDNYYGQLGDRTNVNRHSPVYIGAGYTQISTFTYHTIAVKDNRLYEWGKTEDFSAKEVFLPPIEWFTLNTGRMWLKAGESQTLTAMEHPSNATSTKVVWRSSDTNVATVDASGKVTGVKAGEASITGTLNTSYGEATKECIVVVGPSATPVTGVTLNKSDLQLTVGAYEQLAATITPFNATNTIVAWSSGNPAIAIVDRSGKVTGVKSGKTTITATTEDSGKTATCTVIVTDQTVSVTGLSIDKSTQTLKVGKSFTLKATVSPANATNKAVTWKSGNPDVATVDALGKVTGAKAGSATITATTADGGKTAKCAVTVKAVATPVKSIATPQKKVYLKKGASATLGAVPVTTDGSKATLTWKSSASKIVSVNSKGKVKALKAGKATITAKAENGKTAKVTVYVGGKAPTSLSIKNPPKKKALRVGDAFMLNVAVKPSNAQGVITFKSSKTKILSVDAAGQVKALKAGKSTITVSIGKKTAKINITVK